MPRAVIFGRNAKVTKISGACGMRWCYGNVGPPEGHAPRYWRRICYSNSSFSMMKRKQKSSRNEASTRPARISRSLRSSRRSLIRALPPSPARRSDRPPRPKNNKFPLYLNSVTMPYRMPFLRLVSKNCHSERAKLGGTPTTLAVSRWIAPVRI